MCNTCSKYKKQIKELKIIIYAYYGGKNNTSIKGNLGEVLCSQFMTGNRVNKNKYFDFITEKNNKFEVKYATVTRPVDYSPSKRWVWSGFRNKLNKKDIDYFLLIGQNGLKFNNVIYFLLTLKDIKHMLSKNKKTNSIYALSKKENNRISAWRHKFIWSKQITVDQLIKL